MLRLCFAPLRKWSIFFSRRPFAVRSIPRAALGVPSAPQPPPSAAVPPRCAALIGDSSAVFRSAHRRQFRPLQITFTVILAYDS
ncbi:MAG: hypothetical protein J6Z01_00560 [Bacteroidales bacterium]|nr:hypothetical protein [Bacteroidales bacterium]